MKTTNQLSRDHQQILRALEILKSAAATWRIDPLRTDEDCRTLLEFLKTFADRCHHSKEEKVLFPKLMQAGIAIDGGPLGVMLYEHERARQLISEMEQALEEKHPADFELCANRYAQLLEDHIAKEDNILFAKAEDVLTNEDDAALLHRFDDIESELSEDTHERFHYMLDTLASRYLSQPAKAS
jgi:hemerythrin-like domain-containing protein